MSANLHQHKSDQEPRLFEAPSWRVMERLRSHDPQQRALRDLTRAAPWLEEREETSRAFIQSIEDGYYEMDEEGRLTFLNEPLCKMLGHSAEQMEGMTYHDVMSKESAKRMDHALKEVRETGNSTRLFDLQLCTKQGQSKSIDLSISLLFDSGGRPFGFRGLSRDMTERNRMLEALQETQERYRMILGSIEDGYYEVDLAGNMVLFNDAMSRILGFSSEELKGMNHCAFTDRKTAGEVYETFHEVYRTGKPQKAFGWELIRKNGERRHVETSISLVRNPEGNPAGFRGIARDITELRALDMARKKVMNHLSHELGTPLAIINSVFTRIPAELKRGDVSKVDELIQRGARHVQRLNDLQYKIRDILDRKQVAKEKQVLLDLIETALSLLEEAGDTVLEKGREALLQRVRATLESVYRVEDLCWETLPVDDFLEDLCRQAELELKGRQVQIVRDFEQGITLRMDRKILEKVWGGLLRNAIENTPDEGRVEVKTTSDNGHLSVHFQDFGIGITPENQDLIFQGFFHTQHSDLYASKHPYAFNAGGTGLDLLRTKVFAERLGFKMDFCSARCRYLPSDRDQCPGRVSSCPFIKSPKDCLGSGETRFSVSFPRERFSIEKNGHEERISQANVSGPDEPFRRKGFEDLIENRDSGH